MATSNTKAIFLEESGIQCINEDCFPNLIQQFPEEWNMFLNKTKNENHGNDNNAINGQNNFSNIDEIIQKRAQAIGKYISDTLEPVKQKSFHEDEFMHTLDIFANKLETIIMRVKSI